MNTITKDYSLPPLMKLLILYTAYSIGYDIKETVCVSTRCALLTPVLVCDVLPPLYYSIMEYYLFLFVPQTTRASTSCY
jgi:hypothetical protein